MDANEALVEIEQAKTRIVVGLRWHAAELLIAALLLAGVPLMKYLYPEQLSTAIWVSIPVLGLVTAFIWWRRRVIGREERRLSERSVVLGIALCAASTFVLDLHVVPGPAVLSIIVAATPAIPPLIGAFKVIHR